MGIGEVQTPTTGRVTDITGVGSPRPSFSSFGVVGLASPFAGGALGEEAEKQRRFESENKYDTFCSRVYDLFRFIVYSCCSLYALHVRIDQVNSRLGHAIISMQVKVSFKFQSLNNFIISLIMNCNLRALF